MQYALVVGVALLLAVEVQVELLGAGHLQMQLALLALVVLLVLTQVVLRDMVTSSLVEVEVALLQEVVLQMQVF
jgi:hypothetical protein